MSSSIIAAPSHKTENSIYLAFSIVVVTFIQYFSAWIQGQDTGLDFIPNLALIIVLSPVIAAALVYSSPDEVFFHNLLYRKSAESNEDMERFMLLSMYALRLYRVSSWKLLSQSFLTSYAKTIVLESGDLDSRIWKLRGAFWFVISIPLSISIVAAIYQWDPIIVILLTTISVAVIIMVGYPTWKSFQESVMIFTNLADFHLFDRGLAIVRRWEASTKQMRDSSVSSIDGLSETIYRGIQASKVQDSEEVEKILKPKTHFRKEGGTEEREVGIKLQQLPYRGELQRTNDSEKFHDVVNEECEWLRELIRRESWAAFGMRFSDLQMQIHRRGEIAIENVEEDLIKEWANTLASGSESHSFTQLRALCHRLSQYSLIPKDKDDVVDSLLRYHESHMVNRSWSFHYWTDLTKKHNEVALPFLLEAYRMTLGERFEKEYFPDFQTDHFIELAEGKGEFGKPDVSLEDSKLMTYDE